jgi:hypothetical protein
MAKKLTYEFVKRSFESEGYYLLSKEYVNNKTKLNYVCDQGHSHTITWSDWQRGKRCGHCAKNVKLDIKYIEEKFILEEYILLSKKYINNRTKLNNYMPFM